MLLISRSRLAIAVVISLLTVKGSQTTADLSHSLNITVGGQLRESQPLAAPCFSQPDGTDCNTFRQNIGSQDFHAERYPGFQNMQGEACLADPDDQCLVDPMTGTPPLNSSCRQGVVSRYYIEITGTEDFQAIFNYSLHSNTTLSIKNSGHDYMMRSSRRNSVAIWTSALRTRIFHPSFSPIGCTEGQTTVSAAITIGAGVSMDEAMRLAYANGVIFPAGNSPFIGASGGWLMNGGHSSLSGSFGLAVDRVLQFSIITPDGELRVANECQNPDLFWALRGGGGGAFGIVLDSTQRVDPERPVTGVTLLRGSNSSEKQFVLLLTEHLRNLALDGWGGVSTVNLSALCNPFLSVSEARAKLAPVTQLLQSRGGSVQLQPYSSWYSYWSEVVNTSSSTAPLLSSGIALASKLIPEAIFTDTPARKRMVAAIMDLASAGLNPTFLSVTPLRYGLTHGKERVSSKTSLNPTWYSSVGHLSVTTGWDYISSLQDRRASVLSLHHASELLASLTNHSGTYSNEADPWLENWAEEYWGEHYARLLAIKRTVDPQQLFNCWHCVGWTKALPDFDCTSDLSWNL